MSKEVAEQDDLGTQLPFEAHHVAAAEEAFQLILRLVRMVQSGMQSIDPSRGLSGSQLWALWQISAQPGLHVAELAKALHIHPSTASNLLDKLEARGLVRRERRDADNRLVRLYLTNAAINLVSDIPGPMQGRLRHQLRDVSEPVLKGLLEGLISVLGNIEEQPLKTSRTGLAYAKELSDSSSKRKGTR